MGSDSAEDGPASSLSKEGRSELERFCDEHPEVAQELRDHLERLDMTAGTDRLERREDEPGQRKEEKSPEEVFSALFHSLNQHRAAYDRYEIRGKIGSGGMGIVFHAWDTELKRHLAMKTIFARLDPETEDANVDPRSLARFLEEAQVTGQLEHPGIVSVHELGLDGHGVMYFPMPYVRGRELAEVMELVQEGRDGWTVTRALGVLQKVCEAMAYAHSKDVIHRDLKPSNIMVGRFGEVYVMDWGLSRVMGREDLHDIRPAPDHETLSMVRSERQGVEDTDLYTADGSVIGTPAYMAPEQAKGSVEELDARADIYSIGAMLYQLLSGHRPFVPPGVRQSPRSVLWRVIEGPPEPLDKTHPMELVSICEKAMAREASDRYASMNDLAGDIRAYLEHRVVKAYETGAVAELKKWISRNKALAVTATAATLLILFGSITTSVVLANKNEALGIAETTATESADQARRERDKVLRLSALQELEDLIEIADSELWPAYPDKIPDYDAWLERARALEAGLDPDPETGDTGHLAQLAELASQARPPTPLEIDADRRSDPLFSECDRLGRKIAALQNAQEVRAGRVEVRLPQLDESQLPRDAALLIELARPLVDPRRAEYGGEARGLALARLAREYVEDASLDAAASSMIAWALFANGLEDQALQEAAAALAAAPPSERLVYDEQLRQLREAIAAPREVIATLEHELAALEREIEPTLRFPDDEKKWWHKQLTGLIAAIEAFFDPDTGLAAGISREHGWGISRRLEAARRIEDLNRTDAIVRRWEHARAAIAAAPAYGGLELEPQLGLVPIGADPDSGLWEFWHVQSGEEPQRDADGELLITGETGLVLVLLPGGAFRMGEEASGFRDVLLSPFFLSKYEMTQGQWGRSTGHNPSAIQTDDAIGPGADARIHPVEQVNWYQCKVVCERWALTLPSEAQWEYGARGGTTTTWWTGDTPESLIGAANVHDASGRRLNPGDTDRALFDHDDGYSNHSPVNRFRPNPFGLHDVAGNVREWCLDAFGINYVGPILDPVNEAADGRFRATRGGSFIWDPVRSRAADWEGDDPEFIDTSFGLRPARPIDR